MKMRKKLAAVLAAAMIASVMPMTTFAASDNRLSKGNIHVEKDQTLTTSRGVELVITMKDKLYAGDIFSLNVTDAEWDSTTYPTTDTTDVTGNFSVRRESSSRLIVTAINPIGPNETAKFMTIPMAAKITGDEPTIEIDPIDSAVSAGKFMLAVASEGKALVTLASAPSIANTDEIAKITLDEPFIGAFVKGTTSGRTLTLELRDSDFSFVNNVGPTGARVTGTKAYYGKNITSSTPGANSEKIVISGQTITIELPHNLSANQRGGFVLEGVQVKPTRNSRDGEVKVTLDGNLVNKQVVTVANYGDFTTSLKVAKDNYSVVAGKDIDVEFTLAEEMANALVGDRTVSFVFSKDIVVNSVSVVKKDNTTAAGTLSALKATNNLVIDTIARTTAGQPGIHTNEFTIDNLYPDTAKKSSYTFKANLLVPAGYEGDIMLTAEGRGLEEKKEVVVAKVEAPVTVETKATTVKVGLQKQDTDAKIVIKETKADRLQKGKDIKVSIGRGTDGIKFASAKVKVTEGDLEIVEKDVDVADGVITIPVRRHSTEPSTIEITEITVKTDRTVPQGSYDVKIGGAAISNFTTNDHFGDKNSVAGAVNVLDAVVTAKDFIIVGTPNTEELAGGINKSKVAFTVGATQYLINAQEATLDAAPYIKDGRTMLPVRAVATALGINNDQVIWNQATQTATILADKTIQVKLGSKDMIVNGVVVPMSAAAELKSDRIFVPVAEIARALGVTVAWDAETQTATFN